MREFIVGKIINNINKIKDDDNNNSIDNCDDIDNSDAISIISVAVSALDAFKNDLINETEFNTGNKIIPQLSSQFLNHFHILKIIVFFSDNFFY